jgi:hypothetical protein
VLGVRTSLSTSNVNECLRFYLAIMKTSSVNKSSQTRSVTGIQRGAVRLLLETRTQNTPSRNTATLHALLDSPEEFSKWGKWFSNCVKFFPLQLFVLLRYNNLLSWLWNVLQMVQSGTDIVESNTPLIDLILNELNTRKYGVKIYLARSFIIVQINLMIFFVLMKWLKERKWNINPFSAAPSARAVFRKFH